MADKVKLVIEIPKDIYERCKEYKLWSYDAETLEGAVATSKPLSEIKAEILDYNIRQRVSGSESFLLGYCAGMDKSAEIIDKHIGEDKG